MTIDRIEEYKRLLVEQAFPLHLVGPKVIDPRGWERNYALSSGLAPYIKGVRLVDVGSGAGLPAVPLALEVPGLLVTCLEPRRRAVAFLEEVRRRVVPVQIIALRAEEVGRSQARETWDTATARAVAHPRILLEYCLPLLAVGGRVLLPRTWDGVYRDAQSAARAAELLGASPPEAIQWEHPTTGARQGIIIVDKRESTPPQYPRRPGQAVRNPL